MMRNPPGSRGLLASLVERLARRHPRDEHEKACDSQENLRLEGWQVVEVISVGPTDYALLRRVQEKVNLGLDRLTAREREAVRLACAGASNKEIAHEMQVTASTVRVFLWRACRKVRAADRNDLVRRLTTARVQ
jgi:RNA polymerase sigma factor (sigma-70 family)